MTENSLHQTRTECNQSLLSHEELLRVLEYDSTNGTFIWKVITGSRAIIGSLAGADKGNGYRIISINGIRYLSHRLAWFYFYGAWPRCGIDHINGHRDDNRIRNLREATNSQNMRNRGKPANNTSGFKGVSYNNSRGKYKAEATINGRCNFLGRFDDPETASKAYQSFCRKHHGEFYKAETK